MSIVAQGSAEKVIAPAPFPSHVSGAPRLASGLKTVKKKQNKPLSMRATKNPTCVGGQH